MPHRYVAKTLLILLLGAACLTAGDKPVGTWDCVSSTPAGAELRWTLTLKEENGKLVGTAESEEGQIPIESVEYSGDTLTFRVSLDTGTYVVTMKFSGDKVDGNWKSAASDEGGTIRGVKKA